MLFFDYEKIFLVSKGNSNIMVNLIRRMYDEPEAHKMLGGSSYILNEKVIVFNTYKLTNRQLAEYLGVLSLRNYAEYQVSGDSSLDMQIIPPWVPKVVFENNPLIAINKSKLTFIEEIKYG